MVEKLKHSIDLQKVADGFGISVDDVTKFLNDGRVMGRLGEFIYADKMGGERAKSENSPYDIDMPNGDKIEVRSITNNISFASSKEVGFGRHVTEEGYAEKLNNLTYFVGIDFRDMNSIKFIQIDKQDLTNMMGNGIMRKNKSVSSKNIYNSFDKDISHIQK
jgi:hypothetical protein